MVRSIDELERQLAECAGLVSGLTAAMLPLVRELDVAQVAAVDGSRTLVEWVASRLDIEVFNARRLVAVARRHDTDLEQHLAEGMTVDRAAAVVGLRGEGADDETVDRSFGFDLAGVRRITASHRRITAAEETDTFESRFLCLQPALDESSWKLWGKLSATDGKMVDNALHTQTDALPHNADTTQAQDRADALVSVCAEWLEGETSNGGGTASAEVFVDAALAARTGGEAGATVAGGPRVGPNTLSEILCSGTVRVTVADDQLRTVDTSNRQRAIPPAVRAYVLHRDGHACVIDGCGSRNRLQVHHIRQRSRHGDHDPDNLATICWYHHHVVIHQSGYRLDQESPPQRRRLISPLRRRAP